MERNSQARDISYHEYRVIARLLRAHVDQYHERLRAMIAFGDLVTRDDSVDIDLLEVVDGWTGKRLWAFSGPGELPLRGELRLYVVAPEEFEKPAVIEDLEERQWVEELLQRVRQEHQIIMDTKPGWARLVLSGRPTVSTATPPPSGIGHAGSPLTLTQG